MAAGPWDDYASQAKPAGPWDDYATPAATTEKPFLEKLGNFARNVYNNPPPSVVAARDIIKGVPAAATELTWGADPQAAEQAAGTVAQAAQMGLGFRGLGGEGVFARPISAEARAAPLIPPRVPLAPSAGDTAVEAASRLPGNVELPRYLATEGTTAPRVASGLSQVPFSGQPVVRSANELLTDLGRAKGEIAGGAATAETAGERARSSLEGFTTTRSQKPVSEAYDAVDALINPDARVPLTNTAALVQEMNARRANANIPGTSRAVDIVSKAVKSPLDDVPPELQAGILKRNPDLAQAPGMDYAGIKDLRTYLRSKTPMQLVTEGIDPTEAKRLLGTLKLDLESVISQSGPEALAAWREANALASRTARERKALTRTIGLQGNASAEQVFNRLLTYAGSKSGADLGRLRLAKKAMGPEAWSDVGAAMINRMGMAPEGAFSPDRFVTAFGNMSGAAKQELFSGQQAAALSDLFLVSKHVQDRVTRLSNPSGTARNTIPFAIAAHLWTDPITAVANLVGQRMLAEVLSRPAVVRAATAVSRASLTGNPYARERALAALRAAVQVEGLLPKQPQQDQQLPRMQYGGRPTGPTIVGEDGPEVFVPDQPGTIVPGPFELAAARQARAVRPPGGRQEGAGTQFVEGGYGIPAAYRALNEEAKKAFEAGNELTWGADPQAAEQAAGTVFKQALGTGGAPLVGPAMEGTVLGAGAIRRAARPAAEAVSEAAPRAPEVPMLLGNPELRGSMSTTENMPFTYRGKGPAEWTPQEFEEVGKHFGVSRLGPETPPTAFKYGDGNTFNIPGGLEGQFTYYDLLKMKADGIDPSRIPRDLHTGLQQKLMRSMDVAQPVSPERTWSGLMFGMTSPNNPLFPNQLTQSILRIREPELRQQLAEAIPWKVGDKVSQEQRLAASDKIADMLGINAASKGGLGVRGSTDYTRIAELAQMWEKKPQWFSKTDAESWPNYVERLSSQVTGTSMKTGSFGGVWQDPAHAGISAIDRHMVNEFERTGKLFPTTADKKAFEQRAVERWNNANEDNPVKSYSKLKQASGSDGFLTKMKLEYVGNEQQVKLRTTKGEISPNVPPHLANVDWPSEPSHVKVMGDAYRRALDWNQQLATQHGLNLFPSQWLEWDRIRRRFEPHENMFPGLERMPAMSRDQLRQVSAEHTASGHKTYGKTEGEEGQMNLQPTRRRSNPAGFAYFTIPPVVGAPGLMDLLRGNDNQQ